MWFARRKRRGRESEGDIEKVLKERERARERAICECGVRPFCDSEIAVASEQASEV